MTLGTTMSAITVLGDGVTVNFVYPFNMVDPADAIITHTDATGFQTTLSPTQYTITGIGNPTGGVVTYPLSGAPMPVGALLTIQRLLPLVQTTSVVSQGPTFGAIEDELDYEMMVDQQLQFQLDRTIRLNVADPGPAPQLPPAAFRADKLMGFDAQGNPTVFGFPPPLTSQVPSGWFVVPPNGFDDTANIQAGVNALAALPGGAGGILRLTDGATYTVSGNINVTASNIKIIGYGVTIKATGAGSYSIFNFDGTAGDTPLTLHANAPAYTRFVNVAAVTAGCVPGNWLYMLKAAPDNGAATADYSFMVKIGSVTAGGGGFFLSLESALPIAFNIGDASLGLSAGPMISGVGVQGDIKLDATTSTGALVNGVLATFVVDSTFSGISGNRFTTGAVVQLFGGQGNTVRDITATDSGWAGAADIYLFFQTALIYDNLHSYAAHGFGPLLTGCSYCAGTNLISQGSLGRGVKFQSSLFGHYTNTQGHSSADTGIGIAGGSLYNTWQGCSANDNIGAQGIWFSDQFNEHNKVYGFSGFGNLSSDLFVGLSDVNNEFHGADCGVVDNRAISTRFYGLDTAILSMGVPSPVTLLIPTNSGTALIPPNLNGDGTERWIGGDGGGDIVINVPSPANISLDIDNQPVLVAVAGAATPGADLGASLGVLSLRWSVVYANTVSLGAGQRLSVGPSPPGAGGWLQGSVQFNSAAAVGQPKGWVCTVAGTPGTWVSMGNL